MTQNQTLVALPTLTLRSGHTVRVRHQPADTLPRLQARAQQELATDKPVPPTQRLETAPNEWREIPNEQDADYRAALVVWEARVSALAGEKATKLLMKLGLVMDVDEDALKHLRADYDELGLDLPEDDRTAWLNYVVAPTRDDQARLFEEIFGKALPVEAQVALHRRMFPGDVEGHAA